MSLVKKITQPIVWLTALTILLVCLFGKLSLWQLDRYHLKKNRQDSFTQEMAAPSVPLSHLLANTQTHPAFFTKIEFTGHYLSPQFLLDNRTEKSHIGFDVITPFQLNTGEIILINRGFIPANMHREIEATITPACSRTMKNILFSAPSLSPATRGLKKLCALTHPFLHTRCNTLYCLILFYFRPMKSVDSHANGRHRNYSRNAV